MRDISYRKKQSLKYRRKVIGIRESTKERDCITQVRKNFAYILTPVRHIQSTSEKPQIFVRKSFNTSKRQEKFLFRVKGAFFMARERNMFRVDFCHTLKIGIVWNKDAFSPNKSATLT